MFRFFGNVRTCRKAAPVRMRPYALMKDSYESGYALFLILLSPLAAMSLLKVLPSKSISATPS